MCTLWGAGAVILQFATSAFLGFAFGAAVVNTYFAVFRSDVYSPSGVLTLSIPTLVGVGLYTAGWVLS